MPREKYDDPWQLADGGWRPHAQKARMHTVLVDALRRSRADFTARPHGAFAQMCPKGLESTMFALLGGSFNFSSALSQFSGAWLLETLGCNPQGNANEGDEFKNLYLSK